ncbi:ABC transporter permease [Pontibacter sp. G13]|uniref:ABC transporter permease n=1 Tax=Pontibacter sp. G13 TaxID=3074898 RepID=UPI002889F630|nr:ABC transporter permease [Pontibacter sp. G13]WNJ18598.1 ABC transporter permease [Pontibacter sp. G13]
MLLTLAWRNLWRNKRRTFITVAMVALAVFMSVFMGSLQEGTWDQLISNVVSYHTGYVQVHQADYWDDQTIDNSFEDTEALRAQIADIDHVSSVIPRLETFGLCSSGEHTKGSLVVGIDPVLEDQLTGLAGRIASGTYLQADKPQAVLGEKLAEKLKLGVGDTLVIISSGYHGASAEGKFEVAGLAKFSSPELSARMCYLPLSVTQDMYDAYGLVSSYVIDVDQPRNTDQIAEALSAQLDDQHAVHDWKQMMPDMVQAMEADKGGSVITIAILYLIIAFGIFGTVLMMTAERQYEFGVMTAIGMKRIKLAAIVIMETIFASLIGALVGMGLAFPLVKYLNINPINMGEEMAEAYAQYGMEPLIPTAVDPSIFFSQALTVFFIALFIGLYPLIQISRLDAVKAMRH